MGKEKIENLGFDQVNSWDNEEKVSLVITISIFGRNIILILNFNCVQRKRDLFRKLVEIDKMAERNLQRMRDPKIEIDNNLYHV